MPGASSARNPYDPFFDPITSHGPGQSQQYAPTYWLATAGNPPPDDGHVTGDMDVDVVIIGSGYTGLSCAIHLAKEHGIKATILEANAAAWGCSTRNGGQAQLSAGRLKRSEWIANWGVETAKKMHRELLEAFDVFRDLVYCGEFDCLPQDGGHVYVAHRPWIMPKIQAESDLMNDVFGYRSRILSREEVHSDFAADQEAVGALYEPAGIGIHAAKLAFGYLSMARKLGAKVHPASPVTGWKTINGIHHLTTPGGTVRARAVAIATAAYATSELHSTIKNRIMPILSNSIITRPLTAAEKKECGFHSSVFLTDTRMLRHYYRLMPDDRVQIGGRSSITGADANNSQHFDRLTSALWRKFPALRSVPIEYSWWGWVDMSHDMMPRIFQPDKSKQIFYALGYGGNGVMYSAQAGRRLAQLVAGKGSGLDLPIFQSALPSHGPLTPFRRIGQRAAYIWYHMRDERR